MNYDITKKAEAREITDYTYFQKLLPVEWTSTRTDDQYCKYDATATNGKSVLYVELKGRDIVLTDQIKSEGAFIDCAKVDFLYELYNACIVQFFWKSNVTYVWDVRDKDKWQTANKWMRKNNFSDEKVLKCVYILPFNDENARYTVDLTDYWSDFTTTWEQLSNNNHKQE